VETWNLTASRIELTEEKDRMIPFAPFAGHFAPFAVKIFTAKSAKERPKGRKEETA
jgi:hypothetical protein